MVKLIRGLVDVKPIDQPPFRLKGQARDGVLAKGIAYENKAVGFVRSQFGPYPVRHGQWFKYITTRKGGYAQTDILMSTPGRLVIFECKLTQCQRGDAQLQKMYWPLCHHWTKGQHEIVLVQMFRNAAYETSGEKLSNIDDVLHVPGGRDLVHSFQWLGA